MKRSWRIPILAPALFLFLVAAHVCFAAWDFTAPANPSRSWGASETVSGQYDDNWTSTRNGVERGFRVASDLKLHAAIPLERIFTAIQYDYGVVYPSDVNFGGVNQSHNLNLSATYTVNPRLGLTLNETFISTFEPGAVTDPTTGSPVSLSSGGNYIYETVGGGVNYQLAPRWTLSLNPNWDIWRYQTASIASNNNHEDAAITASAQYELDARNIVGLNYTYSQDVYVNAGPQDGLNGHANTVSLTWVHRFNPQLSLTANGGYTIRNAGDGTVNTSPSGSLGLTYNYGPDSTLSLTLAQSLTESTLGVTGRFSAQENSSLALSVNHRITVRLHAVADASYVYSTLTAPLPGTLGTNAPSATAKPIIQSAVGHIGLKYDFRVWLSAVLDFTHTQVATSDSSVVPPYARNLASIGITLAY